MMIKCLICGQDGKELFLAENKKIFYCSVCRFGWTENFVEPDYSHYHRDTTYQTEEALFRNIFQQSYVLARSFKNTPGKVLEIGSSNGLMLSIFKANGWDVTGVETSNEAADLATERGIKTEVTEFEKFSSHEESFDLIIANHTLEHLKDPTKVMDKIHRLLKKDGIAILAVPNFESLNSEILKENWPLLLPTEHRWYFSPRSLALLGERSSMKVLKVMTNSGLFGLTNPVKEMFVSLIKIKKRFFSNLFNLPVDLVATLQNKGQNLIVVFGKK